MVSLSNSAENIAYHLFEQDELSSVAADALQTLDVSQADLESRGIPLKQLNDIVQLELSCKRHFRWAAIDNFAEKMLQGFVISKADVNPHVDGCSDQAKRYMPHGRSVLLQSEWALQKEVAARGFVDTSGKVIVIAVNLFIAIALSYRLYELSQGGSFDFSEFQSIFQANSQRGVASLVRLLASIDKSWLQLLLASPFLIGSLKGLWDGCRSHPLTPEGVVELQEEVARHCEPVNGVKAAMASYVWYDNARQLISIPRFPNVSAYIQEAEDHIQWDGLVFPERRGELFTRIEYLALHGRGMSKLNAMQSLAKIVHSLSIQDLREMRVARHSKEVLLQILQMKALALQTLQRLHAKDPDIKLERSFVSAIYASYLLFWLGMGNWKPALIFSIFKAAKVTVQALFLKEIIESIIEAINCPDKPGFRMFYGDFEIWANELTLDCFREFVRQFRLLSPNEPFQPFLEQLQNFRLEGLDRLELVGKALTANETQAILQVLTQKMTIKYLDLENNLIGDEVGGIVFPPGLLFLDLTKNGIGDQGAKELQSPRTLQTLDLGENEIGAEGVAGLQMPPGLQKLYLNKNRIGPDGAKRLKLPSTIQSLDLESNGIGPDGVKALELPSSLQLLDLWGNGIGDEGVKGLQLPRDLQTLSLGLNGIGPDGAMQLRPPSGLRVLVLTLNTMGPQGAKTLELPPTLRALFLGGNGIGPDGVEALKFPATLQYLDLGGNGIGTAEAMALELPPALQLLGLGNNGIGPDGAKTLELPSTLRSLDLWSNKIGPDGAEALKLPNLYSLILYDAGVGPNGAKALKIPTTLQYLDVSSNGIGSEGVEGLQMPPTLQVLILDDNELGSDGAKALKPPPDLQSLHLGSNGIGPDGAKALVVPPNLQSLYLEHNRIGDEGAKGLKLSPSLRTLNLTDNGIGNEGVRAILQKVSQTNLSSISLSGNPYNTSALDASRILQQAALLRRCQDKLCHANTPLVVPQGTQTAGATQAAPFFSWLNSPLKSLASRIAALVHRIDAGYIAALDRIGAHLRETLSDTPSYFPNLHSATVYDHRPQLQGIFLADPTLINGTPLSLSYYNIIYLEA